MSVALYGISLFVDLSFYLRNPCPLRFFFGLYLVLVGFLGVTPVLIGSILAAIHASTRRQWGWLAALVAAVGAGFVFLYGVLRESPPPQALFPVRALSWAFDHIFGVTCGSPSPPYTMSSPYSTATALTLLLLVAPLMLLWYSFSSATLPTNRD
jgi:hypothetical protein